MHQRAKSSTGNGHAPKAPPVAEWGATRPSVALIHALGLWGAWLPLDRQDDAATLFALEATKSLAERLLYPIADEALPRLFPAGAGRLRALVALDRSEPPGGDEPSEIKRREEWVAAREAEKAVARLELRCAFVDDLMRHGRWGLDDAGRARGKLGPLLSKEDVPRAQALLALFLATRGLIEEERGPSAPRAPDYLRKTMLEWRRHLLAEADRAFGEALGPKLEGAVLAVVFETPGALARLVEVARATAGSPPTPTQPAPVMAQEKTREAPPTAATHGLVIRDGKARFARTRRS